ncbi:hypothetical protein [Micromonospora chersina]|uniref:hypothetical protein n=1 Tax=Micromonospora chersina TaxID=47854 RepID=UPI003719B77D
MTVDHSRLALRAAVRNLWLAVAELVLNTNEDQPEESDLASAEHIAQLAVEIQGRLAQALSALAADSSVSIEGALRELCDVERLVREADVLYWRDLRAHRPVAQLRASTRRRGGAWPSWWSGVEQSLERCEEPLIATGEALNAAWHELVMSPSAETIKTNIRRRPS